MGAAGATTTKRGSVHAARRSRLVEAMSARELDALLVTDPTDVGYLTGFLGGDSYLLVPAGTRARPTIISDSRYEEELRRFAEELKVHIRDRSFAATLRGLIGDLGFERCGVQGEHVSLAQFDGFGKAIGKKRLVKTDGLVAALRARKDETEVRLIRKAIGIQEAALEAVLPTIEPGQTELEVAARLEAEMKRRGSSEPGFNTIVASGANASLPHHRPGSTRVKMGKPLLIDWGAVWRGYHGDITRTFAVGRWTRRMREIYDIVLEAHLAAADALAPGRTSHEVDAVARDRIAAAGYADAFGHGLGHGMGMHGHEDPRLNPLHEPSVLEPGHVVTIEPGIYLPGVGGVRIEDDFVVTERGGRNLCSLKKDPEWVMLCAE